MTAATVFKASPNVFRKMKLKMVRERTIGDDLITLFYANGVPASNTNLAEHNGDMCWDGESNDIYGATSVTSTTTTWTKIVD